MIDKEQVRKIVKWSSLVLCVLIVLYSHVIFFQTRTGLEYNQTADELPEMKNGECKKIVEKTSFQKWDCYPTWNISGNVFRPPFSGIVVTYNYPDQGVFDDLNVSNSS
jgi:hypothetical protein